MTAPTAPIRPLPVTRTAAAFVGGALIVSAADLLIAAAAHAAGANAAYPPLTAPVLLTFGLAGYAAGVGGWLLVRRGAARPARVLRVLVPLLLACSFVPDLLVAPGIPGADVTGVVGLALMHLVVVGVVVPVSAAIAPVTERRRA